MSAQGGFSRELLQRSIEDRLAYFKNYTVAHPLLREADENLRQAIREPAGASLIFVFGPSGVGKTTLRLRVQQQLIEEALPELQAEQGRIPIASVEAVAPDSGNFSWKDYYKRCLASLSEPLIEHKISYGTPKTHGLSSKRSGLHSNKHAPELRQAVEQALHYRQPVAFIIDEAQHLAKMASGRKLQDQLDCIKSIASMTGIVHILVGTYELLAFRNLSAQLSRRSVDIHFPRYRADREEDIRAFKSVLWAFQRHMPFVEEPELLQHWVFCYERSIGCVGVLKDWLTRALAAALREGATTLTLKHLEKHALSIVQNEKMATEAIEGEAKLTENEGKRTRLLTLLGMEAGTISSQQPVSTASRQRAVRVGQRKPKRDSVGGEEYAS